MSDDDINLDIQEGVQALLQLRSANDAERARSVAEEETDMDVDDSASDTSDSSDCSDSSEESDASDVSEHSFTIAEELIIEQTKPRSRKQFIPPRNVAPSPVYNKADFTAFEMTHEKLPDATQDEQYERNKNYRFCFSALRHKETKNIWLPVNEVLMSLGYPLGPYCSEAKAAFVQALDVYLGEKGMSHPIETFYIRLGPKQYLSHAGFTILIPIIFDYEPENNMVVHVKRNRFQYLKLFYEVELVTEEIPEKHDIQESICRICCLEDLEAQFEKICRCCLPTHLRCPKHDGRPIPTTEEERDAFFCTACIAYLPMDKLIERRQRAADGEYEIGAVLGFNNMRGEGYHSSDYPYGMYYINWKDFPPECNDYVELDASFAEMVEAYWEEQERLRDGQFYERVARKHLDRVMGRANRPSPKPKRKRRYYDDEPLPRPRKRPRSGTSTYVPDTNHDNKYLPVKLQDIMNPEHILRCQQYTPAAEDVREKKLVATAKLFETLKKSGKREIGRRLQQLKGIPEYFCENEQTEWQSADPENTRQVVEFLNRDWSEWTHDTSQTSFEIGEILEYEHPAKKYSGSEHAYGLFATEDIPKGKVLMEYSGLVSTEEEAEKRLDHVLHELDQTLLMELKGRTAHVTTTLGYWGKTKGMMIDPHMYHNETLYMNDFRDNIDDSPDDEKEKDDADTDDAPYKRKKNVSLLEVIVNGWPHVFGVAVRDILKGQELLTDFGASYWSNFRRIHKRQRQIAGLRREDAMEREWEDIAAQREFESKMNGRLAAMRELIDTLKQQHEGKSLPLPECVARFEKQFLEKESSNEG